MISLNAPDIMDFFINGLSFKEYNRMSDETVHPKIQENTVVIKFLVSAISSGLNVGLDHVNMQNIIIVSMIG